MDRTGPIAMPRRSGACLIVALAIPTLLAAQRPALDLSGGFRDRGGRVSLAASRGFRLGALTVGAGPRLTLYQGARVRLTNRGATAPALPDTVRLDPSLVGLNLMVDGELDLIGPLGVGANLDLLGLALGPRRGAAGTDYSPAHGSLFLYGRRDRGSLNSEYFVRVMAGGSWAFRAGVSHYVIGYTGRAGNDQTRYSRFLTVPFVAVSYRP
jgi:hypothetical protein